jgi:hypothetical protein
MFVTIFLITIIFMYLFSCYYEMYTKFFFLHNKNKIEYFFKVFSYKSWFQSMKPITFMYKQT